MTSFNCTKNGQKWNLALISASLTVNFVQSSFRHVQLKSK